MKLITKVALICLISAAINSARSQFLQMQSLDTPWKVDDFEDTDIVVGENAEDGLESIEGYSLDAQEDEDIDYEGELEDGTKGKHDEEDKDGKKGKDDEGEKDGKKSKDDEEDKDGKKSKQDEGEKGGKKSKEDEEEKDGKKGKDDEEDKDGKKGKDDEENKDGKKSKDDEEEKGGKKSKDDEEEKDGKKVKDDEEEKNGKKTKQDDFGYYTYEFNPMPIYHQEPEVHGKFHTGDGGGGTEFKIDNKNSKEDCLKACYKKKLTMDSTINGCTFGKIGHGRSNQCYCERAMYYVKRNSKWTTSYFNFENQMVHGNYHVGDGKGGKEKRIANQNSKEECLQACYKLKLESDMGINGATFGVKGRGRHNRCYCERGMYYRNNNAAWETSYFIDVGEHVMAARDLHGDFKVGDGRGGSEFRIGNKNTKEECLQACYVQKQKKDQRINGVTYGKPGRGRQHRCYCERGMYKRNNNGAWESSYFTNGPNIGMSNPMYAGERPLMFDADEKQKLH